MIFLTPVTAYHYYYYYVDARQNLNNTYFQMKCNFAYLQSTKKQKSKGKVTNIQWQ